MASGMAATARFLGILVGVAGLGAVLFDQTRDLFLPTALAQGISPHRKAYRPTWRKTLSRHLVAGELAGFRAELPAGVTATIYEKGIDAYAGGFAAAMNLPLSCADSSPFWPRGSYANRRNHRPSNHACRSTAAIRFSRWSLACGHVWHQWRPANPFTRRAALVALRITASVVSACLAPAHPRRPSDQCRPPKPRPTSRKPVPGLRV